MYVDDEEKCNGSTQLGTGMSINGRDHSYSAGMHEERKEYKDMRVEYEKEPRVGNQA